MQLKASPDGHFLQYSDGTPFFYLADTAWMLFNKLTEDEARALFKDRAAKGFTVVTCPWKLGEVAATQIEDMLRYRDGSTPLMRSRFAGVMQTIWSPAGDFLDQYWGRVEPVENDQGGDPLECCKRGFAEFKQLD